MSYHIPLKDYPVELKPRERLKKSGVEALSDSELVALLLSTGTPQMTALDVARHLLSNCPEQNVRGLATMPLPQLCRVAGLGLAKASRIQAAIELGRRVAQADWPERFKVNRPGDVAHFLLPRFADKQQEHFITLMLDSQNRVIAHQVNTIGILNSTLIHPREVFQPAVSHHANAIIVAHNHPSGDPQPSDEDLQLTRRLIACGQLMGIEVLDHVILARQRHTSLRETTFLWEN